MNRNLRTPRPDAGPLRVSAENPGPGIRLGPDPAPPSGDHSLLVGFHFGESPQAGPEPMVRLDLAPLTHDRLYETWWYPGRVTLRRKGTVRVAECPDYTVAILECDESGSEDFPALVRRSYAELIDAVRSTDHRRVIKIWNYLGGINRGRHDLERYRQFSVGRAEAFRSFGIRDSDAPTGTAIGTLKPKGFSLIALASRHQCGLTENPRQLSAFHYPRQYGPSSPKFSRGGFVSASDHRLFLISGTAAVVGHESAFPYDAKLQTDETLRNLESLCGAMSDMERMGERLVLDEGCVLRVYLRDPADLRSVADKIAAAFGDSGPQVAFLHGAICRRELVVEIDGVKAAPRLQTATET